MFLFSRFPWTVSDLRSGSRVCGSCGAIGPQPLVVGVAEQHGGRLNDVVFYNFNPRVPKIEAKHTRRSCRCGRLAHRRWKSSFRRSSADSWPVIAPALGFWVEGLGFRVSAVTFCSLNLSLRLQFFNLFISRRSKPTLSLNPGRAEAQAEAARPGPSVPPKARPSAPPKARPVAPKAHRSPCLESWMQLSGASHH